MKGLIAAAVALAVTSASGDQFLVKREFFDAIRFVESTDGRYLGDQDGGKSYGPYQISLAYLKDSNDYAGTNYTLRHFIDDDSIAVTVMCNYWNRWIERKGYEVSYEVLARLHNGGPNGPKNDGTLEYWNKVKTKMEEFENAKQNQAGRN